MPSFLIRSAAAALSSMVFLVPATGADTATKSAAAAELPGQEYNVYRAGTPYRSNRATGSIACQTDCNADAKCASWAYVAATLQTGPRCELKRTIGSSEYRPGSVSGVSSKYYPNGNVRPQLAASGEIKSYPPASFAPYPGSENWPAPYDIPVDQQVLLGGPTRVKSEAGPVRVKMKAQPKPVAPRAVSQTPAKAAIKYAPAQQPMTSVVTKRPARPAPAAKTVYAPVIATPAGKRVSAAPVTFAAPAPKPVATAPKPAIAEPTPTPPSLKLRKNWTDPGYGQETYSVQDTDFIPGDEEAMGGFLEGAPE